MVNQLDMFTSPQQSDEEFVRSKLMGRIELQEEPDLFPLHWHLVWYPDGVHRSIARAGNPDLAWSRARRYLDEYGVPGG